MFLKNDPGKLKVFENFKDLNRGLTKAYMRQQGRQKTNIASSLNSGSLKKRSPSPKRQGEMPENALLDSKERK